MVIILTILLILLVFWLLVTIKELRDTNDANRHLEKEKYQNIFQEETALQKEKRFDELLKNIKENPERAVSDSYMVVKVGKFYVTNLDYNSKNSYNLRNAKTTLNVKEAFPVIDMEQGFRVAKKLKGEIVLIEYLEKVLTENFENKEGK